MLDMKNSSQVDNTTVPQSPKQNEMEQNSRLDNRVRNYTWPKCVRPSGRAHWGEWEETDVDQILVRSADYFTSRQKTKSKRSLFKLAYQEMIIAELEESQHMANKKHSWYKISQQQLPEDTFHLIINIQLKSLNLAIVSYFVMRTDDELYKSLEEETGTMRAHQSTSSEHISTEETANKSHSDVNPTTSESSGSMSALVDETLESADMMELNAEQLTLYNQLMALEGQKLDKQYIVDSNVDVTVGSIGNVDRVDSADGIVGEKKDMSDGRSNNQKKKEEEKEKTDDNDPTGGYYVNPRMHLPKIHYRPLDVTVSLQKSEPNVTMHGSIWKQFLRNDQPFINSRLKLIPHIVKSPWYLRIPNKPVLLGKYSPSSTYRGENYLEIDFQADSTKIAQSIVKAAHTVSKKIVVDIVWVIEGCQLAELPERCLGGVRLFNVDASKVMRLGQSSDPPYDSNNDIDAQTSTEDSQRDMEELFQEMEKE
ncbi:hypothetical protein RFI_21966 [Reticulomyxa filosa]|uniref:Protein ENHANCED DISEASE RESISTANCE 2 C-terminal domain-containing protein n=1 Tax=Reticulomyxa filosa TaxID=46433 RepID=X6MP35_RETFI|nr:hypothetical protein RFI_21966 [Reticulomyxa filosa]|eukprot:ETO15396.1 hypothetical protein RFI_21966 [Reticulomyxa filosa]